MVASHRPEPTDICTACGNGLVHLTPSLDTHEPSIRILDEHIPSLSQGAEEAIDAAMAESISIHGYMEWADAAIRDCRCGERIDGFYEYVDHLKSVFRGT